MNVQNPWLWFGSGIALLGVVVVLWIVFRKTRKRARISKRKLLSTKNVGPSLQQWQGGRDITAIKELCLNIFASEPFVAKLVPSIEHHLENAGSLRREDLKTIIQKHGTVASNNLGGWLSTPPLVVYLLGANGAGKTTTIAKLISSLASDFSIPIKDQCVIGTDTFRAAASDQLHQKLERLDVTVLTSPSAKKPTTALFEGIQQAAEQNKTVIWVDTSGRLHTSQNLIQELQTMVRKGDSWMRDKMGTSGTQKCIGVCDATHGTSLLAQIQTFSKMLSLNGLILSKWDCVEAYGPLFANIVQAKVPLLAVGTGEKYNDFKFLESHEFLNAVFGF